jgi:phosphoglycolate phosphatase
MNTRAYDHVVFDLDGTLADTRDDLADAVNHVLRTLRLPVLPSETICQYIGEGARVLVARALGSEQQNRIEEALALFLPYYAAHLLERTTAYPGVPQVVFTLHERGVTLSLLSNKPEKMSRSILDGLGILPAFSIVLGADSLPARKPDPCGIERLLGQTGTPRERMLLVGDSTIDLETARAAQIAFCGVAWGIRPGELLRTPGVPRVIHQADELLAFVEGGR